MNILAALKREQRRLEKKLAEVHKQLDGVRRAGEALGHSVDKKVAKAGKRVMSAAARSKISKAAKKRWAKFRARAKKAVA